MTKIYNIYSLLYRSIIILFLQFLNFLNFYIKSDLINHLTFLGFNVIGIFILSSLVEFCILMVYLFKSCNLLKK